MKLLLLWPTFGYFVIEQYLVKYYAISNILVPGVELIPLQIAKKISMIESEIIEQN